MNNLLRKDSPTDESGFFQTGLAVTETTGYRTTVATLFGRNQVSQSGDERIPFPSCIMQTQRDPRTGPEPAHVNLENSPLAIPEGRFNLYAIESVRHFNAPSVTRHVPANPSKLLAASVKGPPIRMPLPVMVNSRSDLS